MRRALSLFCAGGVLLAQQSPDPAQGPAELEAALAAVVDLPTGHERRVGVAELLARTDDVDTWLAVCREFGDFEPLEAGATTHSRELQVLDRIEETELHLFVPQSYDPQQPAPLLLWGHGQGGTGKQQYRLWQQVAEQLGMLVLAPRDPNTGVGFTKEPRERAAMLAALRWVRRIANVDENAVFVGGWSRGGHLAWDLMLRHPDLFAGAIPVVGGPLLELGPAGNLRYLENVAHLPIRDLQGSGDDPRLLRNVRLAFAKLKKLRAKDTQLIEFPELGHSAKLSAVDWAEFFTRRREPWPRQVVRIAAEPFDAGEARSGWLEITGYSRRVQLAAQPQVDPRRWDRMDEDKRAAYVLDEMAKYTARLEVTRTGKGRFKADGFGVTGFSLLLPAEHLGRKGRVEVRLQNKPVRKNVAPSAEVLLRDFVERFDRTRLPVVRFDVP